MERVIPACSVATKKSLAEFELLKFSLEQYHEVEWFVATDDYTAEALSHYKNVNVINKIKTDDCSHGVNDPVKNRLFLELIMTKFDAMEAAIEKHGVGFFVDSDMFFVNPLEKRFLDLLWNEDVDAILSPHMTNNLGLETQVGHFNVGFFAVRNKNYLEQHRDMSWKSKELGMYYEQQPLQFTSYEYLTVNAPIYYNIGWWRFNEQHSVSRLQWLREVDGRVMLKNNPAVCFHAHTMKSLDYNNSGLFLVQRVFDIMVNCINQYGNKDYRAFLEKYNELNSTKS